MSLSRARFAGESETGAFVPGAVNRVIQAGLTAEPSRPLFGGLRVRHFGPRPLVEDNSVRSRPTTLVNGEAGYRLSRRTRVMLEAFNLFNAKVSDIDYFYTSRLPGEPLSGIDDIHTHPALPRTARVSLENRLVIAGRGTKVPRYGIVISVARDFSPATMIAVARNFSSAIPADLRRKRTHASPGITIRAVTYELPIHVR